MLYGTGFKLHLICNEKGELLNFMLTPGNVDDCEPLKYEAFIYGNWLPIRGIYVKTSFKDCSWMEYSL